MVRDAGREKPFLALTLTNFGAGAPAKGEARRVTRFTAHLGNDGPDTMAKFYRLKQV